jgi:hypothetical protein
MSQNPYPDQQEIDLRSIGRGIGMAMDKTNSSFFRLLAFLRRNIIIVAALFIAGAVLGYFADKGRSYKSHVIVQPHFGSTDYMYDKIALLQSKLKTGDTVFLKSIGIKDTKVLSKISVSPINDVYQFVNNNTQNFELLKLMVEDGDVKKIIEDPTTSKNYPHHAIVIQSNEPVTESGVITPILEYLNDSDFFIKVQKEYVNNVRIKLEKNEQTLAQINGLLDKFSNQSSSPASSTPNLVYYNDNTQLNDVLKTKDELIREQGNMRIDLVSLDQIIKRNSSTLNLRDEAGLAGMMKVVLPILFIFLFIVGATLVKTYRSQKAKFQQG